MTTIDVQPSVYYTAAAALHTSAANLFHAFDSRADALDQCGSMAGSYDEAKSWAASYDANAHQALQTMFSLALTMDTYAGALRDIGYTHQLADWKATTGDKGDAPTRPADPLPAVTSCRRPPPSAGGPGNGLSDAIHLAEKVGITIPDGDLDKLGAIAAVWTDLQNDHAIATLADELGRIVSSVSLVTSPEATQVVEDLQSMKLSATTIVAGCADLAQACHTHHDDLHDLREKLKKQLEDLAKDLLEQEAITLAIGVAASFLTFGAGAVIAAARTAQIVEKFATPIREMVTVWRDARKAKNAIKAEQKLAAEQKKMADIEQRIQKNANDWLTNGGKIMTNEERWMLTRGPSHDLIRSLRNGDKLTAEQQKELDAFNTAMSKAPLHTGPVRRDIQLTPDELRGIQEGKPWSGNGFMNSSTNPNGVGNGDLVPRTNTTFQIMSKTGRDMSEYGGTPDEVAFKAPTQFFVNKKYPDPRNPARTIIQLIEQ